VTRSPAVYRGNPFVIEVGLAYGTGGAKVAPGAAEAEEAGPRAEGEEKEAEVPLAARIIRGCNAYVAMTSDRPYRDAMPSRVARLRLAQAVESQFDTNVVAAFEAILAGSNEAYRAGLNVAFETEASAHEALSLRTAIAS